MRLRNTVYRGSAAVFGRIGRESGPITLPISHVGGVCFGRLCCMHVCIVPWRSRNSSYRLLTIDYTAPGWAMHAVQVRLHRAPSLNLTY